MRAGVDVGRDATLVAQQDQVDAFHIRGIDLVFTDLGELHHGLPAHLPLNFGLRFSTKALAPSSWSSVFLRMLWPRRSRCRPVSGSTLALAFSTSLARPRARGALAASCC